jgi:integrase
VVLSRAEVRSLLQRLDGPVALVAELLYGSGLRLLETLQLRMKDVDLVRHEIHVPDGKGRKDRRTVLPTATLELLRRHLLSIQRSAKPTWPQARVLWPA